MIGTNISHYRILEKLGEGGMGVVYKAHDTKLNRDVALKFLPKSLSAHEPERARFLQEAQAVAALNHPHICGIHSIGEEGEQQYIEMEFVDGVTLRRKIEDGKLRIEDGIGYAIQIAEALQEAHCHGIVHRDIKADNIMVNSKNQVKVMDFGLAKLKGSLHLTKTSSTVGTLAYMAPEQIEGGEVDARGDIFSFGIVFYEMLTGHLPFRGEHEAAIVYSIVNEAPAPLQQYLPDAPPELLHILDRALEKDREDRYQTVQDMLIDLRRLKKDSTRVTRHLSSGAATFEMPPTMEATGAKRNNRKRTWITVGTLVALVAVTLSVVLLRKAEVRLNPNRTSVAITLPFRLIQIPSLSSDGKWMAFAALEEEGTYDIYMMNAAGSTPRRVSEDRALSMGTCEISPDLSRIVYDCGLGPSRVVSVKMIATEGGQTRTLVDTGFAPHWTLDGKRVGYLRVGRAGIPSSGRFEIWSIRPDGSDRRLELVDTVAQTDSPYSYCWSPDGRSIAWVRNFPGNYGEVMTRELASGREEQITHDKERIDEVNWAANGQILFISHKSGQSNLWMIPAGGGGEAVQITHGTVPIMSARISLDTKKIVFWQNESISQIWTSARDGNNARQVTFDEVNIRWCAYSPDGRSIAAVIGNVDFFKLESSLCVMDRQGKNRKVLVSGADLGRPYWSPDGKWLTYEDSGKVWLIDPANPGTPRQLVEGSPRGWMEEEDLVIWREQGMKSYQYSAQKRLMGQLLRDSLEVYAKSGTARVLYRDYRQGTSGWWLGSLDSTGSGRVSPIRLSRLDATIMSLYRLPPAVPADMQFVVYQTGEKAGEGIYKVSLVDRTVQRLGTLPSPRMAIYDVTSDGKELLWIKWVNRAKLSMIENPFE